MERALEALENLTDVVQAETRSQVAQVARRHPEWLGRLRDAPACKAPTRGAALHPPALFGESRDVVSRPIDERLKLGIRGPPAGDEYLVRLARLRVLPQLVVDLRELEVRERI